MGWAWGAGSFGGDGQDRMCMDVGTIFWGVVLVGGDWMSGRGYSGGIIARGALSC